MYHGKVRFSFYMTGALCHRILLQFERKHSLFGNGSEWKFFLKNNDLLRVGNALRTLTRALKTVRAFGEGG